MTSNEDLQRFYRTDLKRVSIQPLDERSVYLRSLIFRALINGGRGHVGSALSMVETIRVVYDHIISFRPDQPDWPDRDRYLLSKGHGCLALYALLADKGFFDITELDRFCKFDSLLSGHPETRTPGVEACTGALGHGLPIGLGIALALRNKSSEAQVFVHIGDGESNEGSNWEAASAASKHATGKLNVIMDYNKLQSAGSTQEIQPMEPIIDKWASFGFQIFECNGHNVTELKSVLSKAKESCEKPTLTICHTIKGKGLSIAENNPSWHHKSKLNEHELNIISEAIGRF